MAQSLSRILLHLVFSTKERSPAIPPDLAGALHAYLAAACRMQGCEAYRVGGTEDHVHIACTLPRTLAVSKLLEEIKKTSSAWLKVMAIQGVSTRTQTYIIIFTAENVAPS